MEDLRKRLDNFLKEQGYSPIDVTMGEKKIRIARVEDPKAVYAEFEAIKQELVRLNSEMRAAHNEKRESLEQSIKQLGINPYEYKGRKMEKRQKKWFTELLNELITAAKPEYTYTSYIGYTMTNAKKYIEEGRYYDRQMAAIKEEKEQEGTKMQSLMELAVKYLAPGEIALMQSMSPTREQIEKAVCQAYEKSMLGQEIGTGACSECDEYEVGNRRCGCGNRRISFYAEIYYNKGIASIISATEAY